MTLEDIEFYEDLEYIASRVDRKALLAQLTEEGAELTQAAAKQMRAERIVDNPTPVTPEEGMENVSEEAGDVLVTALAAGAVINKKALATKAHRWRERLEAEDQAYE